MNTTTFAPKTATQTCLFCQEPANDFQGLVRESGYYAHANCSARQYEIVSEVSFPDCDTTGPALCTDCEGLHDPNELCEDCQELYSEWESDHAPDYDALYERTVAARDYLLVG